MSDYLRLFVLSLVIFAVTFIAFLFSNPTASEKVAQRLGLAEQSAAVARERLEESDRILRLSRSSAADWDGLTGFPSQTQLVFPIPDAMDPVRAQLQLDLESELVERGDGMLSVYVNGNLMDAILLEPGRSTHRLTYDLSELDIATGRVTVSLEANGTTNYGQICPANVTNLGAIAQILPSSALMLEIAEPLSNPALSAALVSPPLQIATSSGVMSAAWASQWLARHNVGAEISAVDALNRISITPGDSQPALALVEGKLSAAGPAGVSELARIRGGAFPSSYGQSWPLSVSALTVDTLTHTFRASTRWQLNYKLADLPEGRVPDALNLQLKTSALQGDNYWTLRVTLNGALVHSSNHPGIGNDLALQVALPVESQLLRNRLVVTLIDNSPNQSICRAGSEQVAQLLPGSTLTAGAKSSLDSHRLIQQLALADEISLPAASQLDLEGAVQLSRIFDLLLPLDTPVDLMGAEGQVTIRAGQGNGLSELLQAVRSGNQNVFIVWGGGEDRDATSHLTVEGVDPSAPPLDIPADRTGVVVTW